MSTRLPVDLSTRLHVYRSTLLPVYGTLRLEHLSSRQGESVRALLCKMWQCKGYMSVLSTGNRVFMETSVYLSNCLPVYMSTCRPVYPSTCLPVYLSTCLRFFTFKEVKSKTKGIGACITVQDVAR